MLRKHPAPRTHAKATGAVRHHGSHRSGEISHIRREISRAPVVLVLERDGLLRWALFETLNEAGYRVLSAPSGETAEAWLHEIDQDLSLALVDEDAWPLASPVRAILQTRWPALPIVVMLHDDHATREGRTRQMGAAEVLIKPFDLQDLTPLVERLTGYRQARTDTTIPPAV
jgi:DNA-binding NtrC family response regulator